MMPIPVAPPPIQQSRRSLAPFSSPASTSTVEKIYRPLPPPPSRISQQPVVIDRWGHMAGLGADTARLQTPEPAFNAGSLLQPVACAVAGFLVFGLLSK